MLCQPTFTLCRIECVQTGSDYSVGGGGSWIWADQTLGIPFSVGMNLRDDGDSGFLVSPSEIVPSGEEIWAFHEAVANFVVEKFVGADGEAKI